MSRTRTFPKLLASASWLVVLLAVSLHDTTAVAQVQVVVVPPEVVTTTEPVYYEGRPCYWYRGRWMYREGGQWAYYREEPVYLYQRRRAWVPVRRYYGGGGYRSYGYRHRGWGRW